VKIHVISGAVFGTLIDHLLSGFTRARLVQIAASLRDYPVQVPQNSTVVEIRMATL